MTTTKFANLPVIDISSLISSIEGTNSSMKNETINELIKACKRYGMFKVKGHNVSELSKVIEASKAIFRLDQEVKDSIRFDSVYQTNLIIDKTLDELSVEEKALYDIQRKGKEGFTRGYIPLFGESGRKEYKELKEAFSYGYTWSESHNDQMISSSSSLSSSEINHHHQLSSHKDDNSNGRNMNYYSNPLQGENIWPQIYEDSKLANVNVDKSQSSIVDVDRNHKSQITYTFAKEHKDILNKFFTEMADTAYVISHALLYAAFKNNKETGAQTMAIGDVKCGEKKESDININQQVHNLLKEGDTISLMRAFHYFSTSRIENQSSNEKKDEKKIIGSSSHTDWGLLTLILQDHVGGLQLYDEQINDYLDVPGDEGEGYLICNAGDYMSLLSGFEYMSPIHRVLPPPANMERYSMVFFYYPNYDTSFELQVAKDEIQKNRTFQSEDEEKEDAKKRRKKELSAHLGFNTLLDLHSNGTKVGDETDEVSSTLTFGQYIQKKWQGVNTMG